MAPAFFELVLQESFVLTQEIVKYGSKYDGSVVHIVTEIRLHLYLHSRSTPLMTQMNEEYDVLSSSIVTFVLS